MSIQWVLKSHLLASMFYVLPISSSTLVLVQPRKRPNMTRLENSTRPLVFTSGSGCRASENFILILKVIFFPCMPIFFCEAGQVPILTYFEAWWLKNCWLKLPKDPVFCNFVLTSSWYISMIEVYILSTTTVVPVWMAKELLDEGMKFEPQHVISNNVAFWQVQTQTSLCSLLLSLETPKCVQPVAYHS